MRALVSDRDETLLRRHAIERLPRLARLDAVDAASPSVEWHMAWRRGLRPLAEREDVGDDALTKARDVSLDLGEHLGRQSPTEVRAEHCVRVVLVTERRWFLVEGEHRRTWPACELVSFASLSL